MDSVVIWSFRYSRGYDAISYIKRKICYVDTPLKYFVFSILFICVLVIISLMMVIGGIKEKEHKLGNYAILVNIQTGLLSNDDVLAAIDT